MHVGRREEEKRGKKKEEKNDMAIPLNAISHMTGRDH